METVILYIGIAVVAVIIFFLIVRISSNAIEREIKRNPDLYIGDDNDSHDGDYQAVFKKDWGFEVVEGDLDGAPDVDFLFKLKKPLTKKEETEITKIFGDWYKKGFGNEEEEGEFGGHFLFMNTPTFKDEFASFGFDMGTVLNLEKALESLLNDLKKWNTNQIDRMSFGHDEEIFYKIFPED